MRYTPRVPINHKLKDKIGEVAISNCFPTFRGRLLYIREEKCYFEILENPIAPKYTGCAGQIEYLPEDMVMCLNFEN